MTLRDLGIWSRDLWRSVQDGFQVVATQSFWDWPLWISIPIVIVILVGVPALIRAGIKEGGEGEPESIRATLAFGVLAVVSALATFDLWVSQTIFQEGDENVGWLRIGYPIMTTFFGGYFMISIAKRRRR